MQKTKICITEASLIRGQFGLGYTVAGEFIPRWNTVLTEVVCHKCGTHLGEVNADVPCPDLCMTCFVEAFHCDVTPAALSNECLTGQENNPED